MSNGFSRVSFLGARVEVIANILQLITDYQDRIRTYYQNLTIYEKFVVHNPGSVGTSSTNGPTSYLA